MNTLIFKIEYEKDKEGWVSNKYTTLATPAPTSSPSPSATPTI